MFPKYLFILYLGYFEVLLFYRVLCLSELFCFFHLLYFYLQLIYFLSNLKHQILFQFFSYINLPEHYSFFNTGKVSQVSHKTRWENFVKHYEEKDIKGLVNVFFKWNSNQLYLKSLYFSEKIDTFCRPSHISYLEHS